MWLVWGLKIKLNRSERVDGYATWDSKSECVVTLDSGLIEGHPEFMANCSLGGSRRSHSDTPLPVAMRRAVRSLPDCQQGKRLTDRKSNGTVHCQGNKVQQNEKKKYYIFYQDWGFWIFQTWALLGRQSVSEEQINQSNVTPWLCALQASVN